MKGMPNLMVNMDAPHLQLGGLGKHLPVLANDLRRRRHGVDLLANAGNTVGEMPESAGSGRVERGGEGLEGLAVGRPG